MIRDRSIPSLRAAASILCAPGSAFLASAVLDNWRSRAALKHVYQMGKQAGGI